MITPTMILEARRTARKKLKRAGIWKKYSVPRVVLRSIEAAVMAKILNDMEARESDG